MKIQTLPGDPGKRQKRTRRGRGHGSGKGQTSGRGNKGLQARSGGKKGRLGDEGGQMPLIRRLPKRGFHPLDRIRFSAVNVGQLDKFPSGAQVGPETLLAARLVRKSGAPIKILAGGEVMKPLHIRAHAFSQSARQKILGAGGSCETIERQTMKAQ